MSQLSSSKSLPSFSRRTLFKFLGAGAIAGGLGYTRLVKPQPTVVQQDLLDLPYFPSQPKSVVVVGAGLAGLACAYELSRRGFAVTLLERSPQLGGKIASWKVEVEGQTFAMEHGFHGFFPQYYNLRDLIAEIGISDNFKSLESYAVLFKDGTYAPEIFRPNHSAFPWNIVDLAIASSNWQRWGINLANRQHWQVFREIGGFGIPRSFERLDTISVADWAGEEFPRGLYDLYFLPFAKSSLNAPDSLSVGELMQFFHFYFFGNPEGLAFYGTRQDMGTSVVEPIANSIRARGGNIVTEASVSEIQWERGKIHSLRYRQGGASESAPFWVSRNRHFAAETGNFFGAGDRVFAAIPGTSEALSLRCTHQGCTVQMQADGGFVCPCHGSRFDAEGRVLSPPARRDLARYRVLQETDEAVELAGLADNSAGEEVAIAADFYVIATDVPGVQQLFGCCRGDVDRRVQIQVEKLAIADPFAVARFWFDRDFKWDYSHFTSLSGYQLTDSITLYHRIQEEYIAWHRQTGGSVVELHAYCYKEREFPTQDILLETFERELLEIVPELARAKQLHRELVNQKNFSGYPPGSYRDRPKTATGVPNLIFAGDWVKMPFPCGLMERAVSSGLLAANAILHQEGLQRRSLYSVSPEGILNI